VCISMGVYWLEPLAGDVCLGGPSIVLIGPF
jgi:hypothetical protein